MRHREWVWSLMPSVRETWPTDCPWLRGTSASRSFPMISSGVQRLLGMLSCLPFSIILGPAESSLTDWTSSWGAGQGGVLSRGSGKAGIGFLSKLFGKCRQSRRFRGDSGNAILVWQHDRRKT